MLVAQTCACYARVTCHVGISCQGPDDHSNKLHILVKLHKNSIAVAWMGGDAFVVPAGRFVVVEPGLDGVARVFVVSEQVEVSPGDQVYRGRLRAGYWFISKERSISISISSWPSSTSTSNSTSSKPRRKSISISSLSSSSIW
jgi:hypothetical protein